MSLIAQDTDAGETVNVPSASIVGVGNTEAVTDTSSWACGSVIGVNV